MIKKIFLKAMQARQNMVIYAVMACALLMTSTIQSSMHGNLQTSNFIYVFMTAGIFILWAIIDYKFRHSNKN